MQHVSSSTNQYIQSDIAAISNAGGTGFPPSRSSRARDTDGIVTPTIAVRAPIDVVARVTDGTASRRSFTTSIERDARGRVVIRLPFDPSAEWGAKARHHITGTVGDRRVRGPLTGEGGAARLVLGPAWWRDADLEDGARVPVTLWPEGPQQAT